ncbi:hypothetical protein NIES4071_65290 [Calothrix sp. NIES-4071]|nr:hypothetical protein NIES4071_65290 [Calothrix sp. NIES-4071]BAZ60833.1 hypothetical protein NIES4105_65250 [Calothrix sp. NIES-4105]
MCVRRKKLRKLRVFISLLVACVIAVSYYTPSNAARDNRNLPTSVTSIGRIEQVAAFTGPMPTGVKLQHK